MQIAKVDLEFLARSWEIPRRQTSNLHFYAPLCAFDTRDKCISFTMRDSLFPLFSFAAIVRRIN